MGLAHATRSRPSLPSLMSVSQCAPFPALNSFCEPPAIGLSSACLLCVHFGTNRLTSSLSVPRVRKSTHELLRLYFWLVGHCWTLLLCVLRSDQMSLQFLTSHLTRRVTLARLVCPFLLCVVDFGSHFRDRPVIIRSCFKSLLGSPSTGPDSPLTAHTLSLPLIQFLLHSMVSFCWL